MSLWGPKLKWQQCVLQIGNSEPPLSSSYHYVLCTPLKSYMMKSIYMKITKITEPYITFLSYLHNFLSQIKCLRHKNKSIIHNTYTLTSILIFFFHLTSSINSKIRFIQNFTIHCYFIMLEISSSFVFNSVHMKVSSCEEVYQQERIQKTIGHYYYRCIKCD